MPFFKISRFFKFINLNKEKNVEATKVFQLASSHFDGEKISCVAILKITKGEDAGKQFILDSKGAYAGRKSSCQIYLRAPNISRYHAFFGWEKKKLYLEDKGSTNGTYVNNQLIRKKYLKPGDCVRIGDTEIVVEVIQ